MVKISIAFIFLFLTGSSTAFTVESNRRHFLEKVASSATIFTSAGVLASPAIAAPEILNLPSGIKYAVTQKSDKGEYTREGDIVAIEYTGYLSNGQIFDATHAVGKKNALLFKAGSNVVIPGLNEVVLNMRVGEKVQAIIPPNLAFGDDGICLDNGECLIKPGSALVYDVYLKKSSIPPP